MPRFADVVTQTIRSFPEALTERLFRDPLENWWQDYSSRLEDLDYPGGVSTAFFIAGFSTLGRVSKIDGRICEAEINYAHSIMDQLKLTPEQKQLAIRLFNEGKRADFDLDLALSRFYRLCGHRVSVLQIFVQVQLQAAYADNDLSQGERTLLQHICKRLDISESIFKRIEQRVRVTTSANHQLSSSRSRAMSLTDACTLLGVSRQAEDKEITRAYRRKMSQYHPDKLMARGSNEAEINAAIDKVQEVKWAYEIVLKAQKIR